MDISLKNSFQIVQENTLKDQKGLSVVYMIDTCSTFKKNHWRPWNRKDATLVKAAGFNCHAFHCLPPNIVSLLGPLDDYILYIRAIFKACLWVTRVNILNHLLTDNFGGCCLVQNLFCCSLGKLSNSYVSIGRFLKLFLCSNRIVEVVWCFNPNVLKVSCVSKLVLQS